MGIWRYLATLAQQLLTLVKELGRIRTDIQELRQDVRLLTNKVAELKDGVWQDVHALDLKVKELEGQFKLVDERGRNAYDELTAEMENAYAKLSTETRHACERIAGKVELELIKFERRLPPPRGTKEEN